MVVQEHMSQSAPPFSVPYRALLPLRARTTNPLAPMPLSASHLAYSRGGRALSQLARTLKCGNEDGTAELLSPGALERMKIRTLTMHGMRLAAVFVALLPFGPSARAAERLNIISIVTDDQARWAVGAYGNREVKTPHLDRLAAEGALFTNAFVVTPVCSPSRATFLSGRHGTQVGVTDFISQDEADAGVGLARGTVTWPAVLQREGYVTGLFGKWHLGTTLAHHPTRFGIDEFAGSLRGSFAPVNPAGRSRARRFR